MMYRMEFSFKVWAVFKLDYIINHKTDYFMLNFEAFNKWHFKLFYTKQEKKHE